MQRTKAFSLVELLVVIGIIMLVLAAVVPAMSRMMVDTRVASAADAMGTASAKARAYATLSGSFPSGDFQGSALIVTPANELRFTRHEHVSGMARDGLTPYMDVPDQSYSRIHRSLGVVGIVRPQVFNPDAFDSDELANMPPALVPPPFAVRFSDDGMLAPGAAWLDDRDAVFYDHDNSGDYEYSPRPDDYDPTPWMPELVGQTADNWDSDFDQWLLPFGALDSVVGVVVFDRNAFSSEGYDLAVDGVGLEDEARDWILENGEAVLFNRYSGGRLR